MIHIDPAAPDFNRLRPRHQALIYAGMGWTIEALADEFNVTQGTVMNWLNPEAYDRYLARKKARKQTPEGKARKAEYQRRYRAKCTLRQTQMGEA